MSVKKVCVVLFFLASTFINSSFSSQNRAFDSDDEVRILSIDGGGIRGIIPAEMLRYIEDRVSLRATQYLEKHLDETQVKNFRYEFHYAKNFQVISGTSTGGIIALALNVPSNDNKYIPKYKSREVLDIYRKEGNKIFKLNWWEPNIVNTLKNNAVPKYSSEGLEGVFEKYFGDTRLKECIAERVIITSYELMQEREYDFESKKAKEHRRDDFLFKEIGRATSAAPTYFSSAKFSNRDDSDKKNRYADGGLISNNPTLIAFMKAQEQGYFPKHRKFFILSLGTGQTQMDNLSDLTESGKFSWAQYAPSIMIDGHVNLVDVNMTRLVGILNKLEVHDGERFQIKYHRFQPYLTKKRSELDSVNEVNIDYLSAITSSFIFKHKAQFDEIISHLYEKCFLEKFEDEIEKLKTKQQAKL